MICALTVMSAATSAAALDGPEDADEESSNELVEIDGWQIDAAHGQRRGLWTRFEDVQAQSSKARWRFRADSLEVMRAPQGQVRWMWATGEARIWGPDDLYVSGHHLLSFGPQRHLDIIADGEPATAGADTWRLSGRRVFLELRQARATIVPLESPMASRSTITSTDEE